MSFYIIAIELQVEQRILYALTTPSGCLLSVACTITFWPVILFYNCSYAYISIAAKWFLYVKGQGNNLALGL